MTDVHNRRGKLLNDEGAKASTFQKVVEVHHAAPTKHDHNRTTPRPTSYNTTSPHGLGHLLTHSPLFRTLTTKAYHVCDADGSGTIDQSELYAGMLLIHLNLAKYAGPAACYPPTRTVCNQLFEAADWDQNGSIDQREFAHIVAVLCAQILQRMLIYYLVLILLVPILAGKVVVALSMDTGSFWANQAAYQTVSMSLFFLAIPLIWNKIDEWSERRLQKKKTEMPQGGAIMETMA